MKNPKLRETLRFSQWVAITFLIVLGGLMIHDVVRSRAPLSDALQQLENLREQKIEDPVTAKTIRDLDYLYRGTRFQTLDQRNRGFLYLGIGFLVLCFLMIFELNLFPPQLEIPRNKNINLDKERKQMLIFSIAGITVLCVIVITLRFHLPASVPTGKSIAINTAQPTENISVAQQTVSEIVTDSTVASPSEIAATESVKLPDEPDETASQNAQKLNAETIILADAMEAETHQWPQFRGSILPNKNKLPINWNFQEKWRVPISLNGYNSPVVWDNCVFLAGGTSEERTIFCYDTQAGKELWKVANYQSQEMPDLSEDTGYSAPTLCVDKEQIYGIFATGELICCTHKGELVWRKQLQKPEIMYGYASSPALLGDKLLIQYDLDENQTFYAFDIHTGEILWATKRKRSPSWSSPEVWIQNDKSRVFTACNTGAEVLDVETGEVIWNSDCLSGEIATSAFAENDTIYFSNSGGFTGAFSATDGSIIFQNEDVPAPDVASSVLYHDMYVLFSSGGSIFAIDTTNGEELYEEMFDNGFYASPVIIEDKIIAVNMDGDLLQLSFDREKMTIEQKYSIGEKIVSIPAFHQGNIIVRTFNNELVYLESKNVD